eukprot:Sspe_Gene.55575::Locus_30560_Transcript_1_1_Confidence_1.000_Length_2874::g.55575::m.55575
MYGSWQWILLWVWLVWVVQGATEIIYQPGNPTDNMAAGDNPVFQEQVLKVLRGIQVKIADPCNAAREEAFLKRLIKVRCDEQSRAVVVEDLRKASKPSKPASQVLEVLAAMQETGDALRQRIVQTKSIPWRKMLKKEKDIADVECSDTSIPGRVQTILGMSPKERADEITAELEPFDWEAVIRSEASWGSRKHQKRAYEVARLLSEWTHPVPGQPEAFDIVGNLISGGLAKNILTSTSDPSEAKIGGSPFKVEKYMLGFASSASQRMDTAVRFPLLTVVADVVHAETSFKDADGCLLRELPVDDSIANSKKWDPYLDIKVGTSYFDAPSIAEAGEGLTLRSNTISQGRFKNQQDQYTKKRRYAVQYFIQSLHSLFVRPRSHKPNRFPDNTAVCVEAADSLRVQFMKYKAIGTLTTQPSPLLAFAQKGGCKTQGFDTELLASTFPTYTVFQKGADLHNYDKGLYSKLLQEVKAVAAPGHLGAVREHYKVRNKVGLIRMTEKGITDLAERLHEAVATEAVDRDPTSSLMGVSANKLARWLVTGNKNSQEKLHLRAPDERDIEGYEWLHRVATSVAGKEADNPNNLMLGTWWANSQMIVLENAIKSVRSKLARAGDDREAVLLTRATYHSGADTPLFLPKEFHYYVGSLTVEPAKKKKKGGSVNPLGDQLIAHLFDPLSLDRFSKHVNTVVESGLKIAALVSFDPSKGSSHATRALAGSLPGSDEEWRREAMSMLGLSSLEEFEAMSGANEEQFRRDVGVLGWDDAVPAGAVLRQGRVVLQGMSWRLMTALVGNETDGRAYHATVLAPLGGVLGMEVLGNGFALRLAKRGTADDGTAVFAVCSYDARGLFSFIPGFEPDGVMAMVGSFGHQYSFGEVDFEGGFRMWGTLRFGGDGLRLVDEDVAKLRLENVTVSPTVVRSVELSPRRVERALWGLLSAEGTLEL